MCRGKEITNFGGENRIMKAKMRNDMIRCGKWKLRTKNKRDTYTSNESKTKIKPSSAPIAPLETWDYIEYSHTEH